MTAAPETSDMTAFLVVDTKIENTDEYEHYKGLARLLAESYGGGYCAQGGRYGCVRE